MNGIGITDLDATANYIGHLEVIYPAIENRVKITQSNIVSSARSMASISHILIMILIAFNFIKF